jgi:nucleoside-diphosphate-sugar epimerase
MKILVTGHLGYVGTVMVPILRAAGHEITGYDCDLYQRCTYDPGFTITDAP